MATTHRTPIATALPTAEPSFPRPLPPILRAVFKRLTPSERWAAAAVAYVGLTPVEADAKAGWPDGTTEKLLVNIKSRITSPRGRLPHPY